MCNRGGLPSVSLYGFSAGGGAIINALAVLNTSTYDQQLAYIGITLEHKKAIITALEKGYIILDCPLKSGGRIIALRGVTPELKLFAHEYAKNNMRPIDVLKLLANLKLQILLHFQVPDEIIGNYDDALFIERLRNANKGTTMVVFGNDQGHNSFHGALWKQYEMLVKNERQSL